MAKKRRTKSLKTRAILPTVLLTLLACLLAGGAVLYSYVVGSGISLRWIGNNTVQLLATQMNRQSYGALEETARALGCTRLSVVKMVGGRSVLAYDTFKEQMNQVDRGERVKTILIRMGGEWMAEHSPEKVTSRDAVTLEQPEEGWRLTASVPASSNEWLLIEMDVSNAVSEGWGWAWILAAGTTGLLILLAILLLIILWRGVIKPVRMMERACAKMDCAPLAEVEKKGVGEIATLAGHLRITLEDMEDRILRERESAANEAREETEMRLTRETNASVLPRSLPNLPGRRNFELSGWMERGTKMGSMFYDYFFIDPGLLCLVIGEVPGSGTAEALFMVVAQTAVRSRLLQGHSLAETMADVNRQLYELGKSFSMEALVATLSVADGRVSYVNAGAPLPLIMQNEDRYEWLTASVYAPLGKNENVSYRVEELRIKQGDRLFFHTSGMDHVPNREGKLFGEERLRVSLNLSRSRDLNLNALLSFMRDEAIAWSEQSRAQEGFSLLALEYRKGEKELAHCVVSAEPESAAEVSAFLKHQFEDNGIEKRHYAPVAVLVEEVFIMCCRWSVRKDTIMVECGIAPDSQMVNIRITAVLGGVDPLKREEETVQNVANFIRNHAEFISFREGEGRDTITMVGFLG